MPHVISSTVTIPAPRSVVWQVLRDVDGYPTWNPFTTRVATTFEVGAPVTMTVALTRGVRLPQTLTMTSYDEGRGFSWGAVLGARALLWSDRVQQLQDEPDGATRYTTTETFHGALVPVMAATVGRWVQRGFDDVARALHDACA